MSRNSRDLRTWNDLSTHYLKALSHPWYHGLVEIQDAISTATTGFLSKEGLKTLHLPITTNSISSPMGLGSDSMPVKVGLFGVDTYLADSMQFALEYGCRLNRRGCYYLMPSFRGEAADETHLCQFYHSEAEISGDLDDVIALVEAYLRYMTAEIYIHCGRALRTMVDNTQHIIDFLDMSGPLPRITMDEARKRLEDAPEYVSAREGFRTLTREGERALMRQMGGFVWVVEPDHLAVPFYQAFADEGRLKARAGDLLFGLGESVGAGERHADVASLTAALALHGVDRVSYEWYAQLREHFPLGTSGFGLGTERYICWLLNHNDVRDCQIFPRFNGVQSVP